uniref:Uncharacterized protein n=1 Tax=Rhizophora mucronata TaxID=61149 RepID=A0A2P2KAB9_RHIMU
MFMAATSRVTNFQTLSVGLWLDLFFNFKLFLKLRETLLELPSV